MIVPTARTATLAALAAPLALVVAAVAPGAWVLVPAAGVALLVLVLLDGLAAGRLDDVRLIAPADAEVGEPLEVTLLADISGRRGGSAPQAALQFDPRLAEGGRADVVLSPDGQADTWRGTATLQPNRRGTGAIEQFWLRWPGPMGLASRQITRSLSQHVRIWPDLSPVRSPALQVFLRDAQFGLIARRIRGEGSQFESLAEYEPGMDRRRIDWKTSARQTRLFAREFESERNNPIIFAFDCGQAMCEPIDGLPRIDRAVSAALTAAYVALKGGDRVSLFGFARKVELSTPFVTDARAFHRLQSAAAGLDYHAQEPNFTLALATLAARLERRSMIVLFSDFSDPTSAELMIESVGRLVQRHVVLFVTMEDSELDAMAAADPEDLGKLAVAVTADTLSRQRALVLQRLRQLGVDVIEAPWDRIGYRLIDRYLDIKRAGSIG
ncbi:hypothetical protein NT2_05_01490 [Caenibius tardaugens NBRC 16725]|uniref:DUF58 domain-containing protein n=1 Tax=Caenibius tardaugens NBRC 16725 TaxID=1219035 RepID=U2ZV20_9SPHN|nr:DUF58 domain-containing protein [Caenibius tardaugens]AZI36580.1 DUF58 domain-containing protein [Caenibius tardaugens NBRC 16725]GAD49229.1 hypothetical protein NT2_05_01490 [Caenibius tardaugens NBRC 16725]